jgi:glycosyltransferase involved in cell wall biosynthesis
VHNLGPGRLGTYRYSPRLKHWLADNAARFGAVIVNGLWQYHGFAAWRALHGTATPYFVFTHGMLDPWFRHQYPLKHLKKCLYWPWAEYRVLRDARAVLFTCEEERRLASQSFSLYSANEWVVSYGTPGPSAGNPAAQREAFLQKFPQLRNKRLLLFLGRIHPKKGCDLLVDAFAAASQQDPALYLVIAGPDSENMQAQLSRRATELGATRIVWTGMLRDELKWGAFRAAEAFVLPSHQENFGIAVAEALACRLPVLISNKVNIWREIEQDGAGLVEDDSAAGTLRLLQRWQALGPDERLKMAERAERCFLKHFHIETAATNLLLAIQARTRSAPRAYEA